MDRGLLSRIDEDLGSDDVVELCFLCSDVINRKRLEGIKDAKDLFVRLEEKGLLDNSSFLSALLRTIRREDLLTMLENGSRQGEETDATPMLSDYRLMLYKIHMDLTEENLEKMKFLLKDQMAKRPLEKSSTALNVFSEMEKAGLISDKNVDKLRTILLELDRQLATTVETYKNSQRLLPSAPELEERQIHRGTNDQQSPNDNLSSLQPSLPTCETQPCLSQGGSLYTDNPPQAESPLCDDKEYYIMSNNPRGLCVIFNNENFSVHRFRKRAGTSTDEESLRTLFKRFGFVVKAHIDLTAAKMEERIKNLCERDYSKEDALVVFILSHGEKGVVFGTDGKEVNLDKMFEQFMEKQPRSLARKPKLFFIQACQKEPAPVPEVPSIQPFQTDTSSDTTASAHADVLIGMATVPNRVSYRSKHSGSIYIQELCKQLEIAARSPQNDDLLTVLTRVNREVSSNCKVPERQMPVPKYTLTKRVVFRFV